MIGEFYIRTQLRFEKPRPVKLAGEARVMMEKADPSLDIEEHLRYLGAILPLPDGSERHGEAIFDTRKWTLDQAKEAIVRQFMSR
jgi:hypothetical protein